MTGLPAHPRGAPYGAYFFDLHDIRGVHIDDVGQDMPNLAAVRAEAMHLLPEFVFDIADDGDRHSVVVIARDVNQAAVYSATPA